MSGTTQSLEAIVVVKVARRFEENGTQLMSAF